MDNDAQDHFQSIDECETIVYTRDQSITIQIWMVAEVVKSKGYTIYYHCNHQEILEKSINSKIKSSFSYYEMSTLWQNILKHDV